MDTIKEEVKKDEKRLFDYREEIKDLPAYKNKVLFFEAGAMVHVFNEDALLVSSLMGYKTVLQGKESPYIKVGFSKKTYSSLFNKIHDSYSLPSVLLRKDEQQGLKVVFEKKIREPIVKSNLINEVHLSNEMDLLLSHKEKMETKHSININKKKLNSFELFNKITDLKSHIITMLKTIPKKLEVIVNAFFDCWNKMLDYLSQLRNVPNFYDQKKKLETSLRLVSGISVSCDQAKELAHFVYDAKGFKNQNSYHYVSFLLSEIGALTGGLKNKYQESYQTVS